MSLALVYSQKPIIIIPSVKYLMHAQYYITHLSRNLCSCGWEVILLCLCTCAVHGPHFYVGTDKKTLH